MKAFIYIVFCLIGFGFGAVLIGELGSSLFGIPNMEGRAGMFERTVGPGEKIQVVMRVPPIQIKGHYRIPTKILPPYFCIRYQCYAH